MTPRVREILSWYESESPALQKNLNELLSFGGMAGSGKLSLLDISFFFGVPPAEYFSRNPNGFDPEYAIQMAAQSGFHALIGNLGQLDLVSRNFVGLVPLILKIQESTNYKQIIHRALELGCVGLALPAFLFLKNHSLFLTAKRYGLILYVQTSEGLSIDQLSREISDCSHLGATIVQSPFPDEEIVSEEVARVFKSKQYSLQRIVHRLKYLSDACLNGRRLLVVDYPLNVDELEPLREMMAGGALGIQVGLGAFKVTKEEVKEFMPILMNTMIGRV